MDSKGRFTLAGVRGTAEGGGNSNSQHPCQKRMHNVPHAQTSAATRVRAPAVRSHFAETVGNSEVEPLGVRPAAGRDDADARSFLEFFDLLIFTCPQVEPQDYANWAATFTAKRSEASGRDDHVRVRADLCSG